MTQTFTPAQPRNRPFKRKTLAALGLLGLGTVALVKQHTTKKKILGGETIPIPIIIKKFITSLIKVFVNHNKKIYLFKSDECFNSQEEFLHATANAKNRQIYAKDLAVTWWMTPLYVPVDNKCFNYQNTPSVTTTPNTYSQTSTWYTLTQCYSKLWYDDETKITQSFMAILTDNLPKQFSDINHIKYVVVFVLSQEDLTFPFKLLRIEYYEYGVTKFETTFIHSEFTYDENKYSTNGFSTIPFSSDVLIHFIEQQNGSNNLYRPHPTQTYNCDETRSFSILEREINLSVPLHLPITATNNTERRPPNYLNPAETHAERFRRLSLFRAFRGGANTSLKLKLAIALAKHDNDNNILLPSNR